SRNWKILVSAPRLPGKSRHGIGKLSKVGLFGKPLSQSQLNGCLPQRQMSLGDDEADIAALELLDESPQLFGGGHVDLRDGAGVENHLPDGFRFLLDKIFHPFKEKADVGKDERTVE